MTSLQAHALTAFILACIGLMGLAIYDLVTMLPLVAVYAVPVTMVGGGIIVVYGILYVGFKSGKL